MLFSLHRSTRSAMLVPPNVWAAHERLAIRRGPGSAAHGRRMVSLSDEEFLFGIQAFVDPQSISGEIACSVNFRIDSFSVKAPKVDSVVRKGNFPTPRLPDLSLGPASPSPLRFQRRRNFPRQVHKAAKPGRVWRGGHGRWEHVGPRSSSAGRGSRDARAPGHHGRV